MTETENSHLEEDTSEAVSNSNSLNLSSASNASKVVSIKFSCKKNGDADNSCNKEIYHQKLDTNSCQRAISEPACKPGNSSKCHLTIFRSRCVSASQTVDPVTKVRNNIILSIIIHNT